MALTDFLEKAGIITAKEQKKDEKTVEENNTVQTNSNSNNTSFLTSTPSIQNIPTTDAGLVQKLQEIFDKANMPGPDLHEFIASLKKFDGKPLDEKTKFEMVFDAQSSVGLTKERLLESGKVYIATFNDVKSEFEKEYKAEYENTVTNLNAQADGIITENANFQKEIENINKKIQDNLIKSQQLRAEATTNANNLAQNKLSFENTYTSFINGVQKYIDGVKEHIK